MINPITDTTASISANVERISISWARLNFFVWNYWLYFFPVRFLKNFFCYRTQKISPRRAQNLVIWIYWCLPKETDEGMFLCIWIVWWKEFYDGWETTIFDNLFLDLINSSQISENCDRKFYNNRIVILDQGRTVLNNLLFVLNKDLADSLHRRHESKNHQTMSADTFIGGRHQND